MADYSPDMKKMDSGETHPVTTCVAAGDSSPAGTRVNVYWYRGVLWQILVIGCVFLCAPGMYK